MLPERPEGDGGTDSLNTGVATRESGWKVLVEKRMVVEGEDSRSEQKSIDIHIILSSSVVYR